MEKVAKVFLSLFLFALLQNFAMADSLTSQKELVAISKNAQYFPQNKKLEKQDAEFFFSQVLQFQKENLKAEFALCVVQSGEVFLSGNFTKDKNFATQKIPLGKTSRALLSLAFSSISSRERFSFEKKISTLNAEIFDKSFLKNATLNSLQYLNGGEAFLNKHSDRFAKAEFEPSEIFALANLMEREFSDTIIDNDSSFSFALASYILTEKLYGKCDNLEFKKLIQNYLFDYLNFDETNFADESKLDAPKIFYPNFFAQLSLSQISNWLIAETSFSIAKDGKQIANIDEFENRFATLKDSNFAGAFSKMKLGNLEIFSLADTFCGNSNLLFVCPKLRVAFFVVSKNSDAKTSAKIASFMLETIRNFTQKHEILER